MDLTNSKKEYVNDNGVVYSCQYYVVFCPKYRRKVLVDGVDKRLSELFTDIANEKGFRIIEMDIRPDAVHLLIDCDPRFGICECIKALKRNTSHPIREEFPWMKSRLPSLWTRNYFVSTAGNLSQEAIDRYYEEQKGV